MYYVTTRELIRSDFRTRSFYCVGLASGVRVREAEVLAERALSTGIAEIALAKVYNAEGRASEGAYTFTGNGVNYYESCGHLFLTEKWEALGRGFDWTEMGRMQIVKTCRYMLNILHELSNTVGAMYLQFEDVPPKQVRYYLKLQLVLQH